MLQEILWFKTISPIFQSLNSYMKYIFFTLIIACALLVSCEKEQESGKLTENETAPELSDITNLSAYNQQIATGVSLLFFHATWCSKCAAQRPAIEGLLEDASLKDVFFGQVDYEQIGEVVQAAGVQGFPTIVFYRDGVETSRFAGQGHSKDKIKNKLLELIQ
jgi:thioredoxin 1